MPSKRELIYERDGGRCVRCGELVDRASFQLDHYPIPRALGGPAVPDNLRVAHRRCNIAAGREVVGERRRLGLPRADVRSNHHRIHVTDDDLALMVEALVEEALPTAEGERRALIVRLVARLQNVAPGNPVWRLNRSEGYAPDDV